MLFSSFGGSAILGIRALVGPSWGGVLLLLICDSFGALILCFSYSAFVSTVRVRHCSFRILYLCPTEFAAQPPDCCASLPQPVAPSTRPRRSSAPQLLSLPQDLARPLPHSSTRGQPSPVCFPSAVLFSSSFARCSKAAICSCRCPLPLGGLQPRHRQQCFQLHLFIDSN